MSEICTATIEILPGADVKGFSYPSHSSEYVVLVINGVGVTGMPPNSIIHKKLLEALEVGEVEKD